ncbi:WXG100 family type VII secretion target [Oryzobacter telluris]|uniref:WXG100 family type VII secretion target n=1 Tax=Oryzobacter telluris TaxID=3149179 RepID=UPI00370DB5B7
MTVVPGDAASLSACARTAREVSRRLEAEGSALASATSAVGDDWTGRTSATTRQAADGLTTAAATLAAQLDHVGQVLQDQATDLADLVARERTLRERGARAGLEVRDGRVAPAWGVSGTADLDAARERETTRDLLQADLDLVAAQHTRRRDFVLEVLRDSTTTLAEVSHVLRRG